MRRIWLLTLLVGIALRLPAQTQADPATIPWMLTQKGIDGKQDLDRVWKALGISGQMRETTSAGVNAAALTFDCDQGCDAMILDSNVDLLLEGGIDEIVMISTRAGAFCRVLLFHQNNHEWRLVDYLDVIGSRYGEPSVNVVASSGKRWLVTSAYYGEGTGVAQKQSDWYELRSGKFRRVLALPAEGHDMNYDPVRSFSTRFLKAATVPSGEKLEFTFRVQFQGRDRSGLAAGLLWEQESTVLYSRASGQIEFRFDQRSSQLTEKFIKYVFAYGDDYGDVEDLSKYYRLLGEHFLEIARNPRDRRRGWLKQLLDREQDISSLEPVRKAFANAR